ncbi:PA2169 family four-helix-bundle protein [Jannaschia sp. LMIT008]|uniref:ferritin-like domain-containing protein n=1 Tax=Jannaschia maritima TaxID=3032585 RepID=UPI00281178F6|nr:PA2169 family four-helix-bundle protein [Jannaschia sp. LMIT008]
MTDRIDALKTLLTRLVDSREGYREARDDVNNAALKSTFDDFIARRDRDAAEIRSYLTREGHSVDEDGSLLASAHRSFMGLKDAVTGSNDATILAEIVRGEKKLLGAYDDALAAAGGTSPEYAWLTEQHSSLRGTIQQLETRQDLAA